jgi:glyoxylase-like metal-dependent hydrolase (beta-lactamase superfamily II)
MRYGLIALAAVLFLLSGRSGAWAAEAKTEKFTVGKAEVWAVADSTGDRDMSVFIGASGVLKRYAPSGRAPSAIMTFLVKTEGETILIDAGLGEPSGERASLLMAGLERIGVAPEDITLVLITHMHGDHIGGLVRDGRKAFPSAHVLSARHEHDFWLGEKSAERFPDRKANIDLARRVFGIYGAASETFEFGALAAPGIRALDARGHTPGHTAFLLESGGEKILFWGDLVHAAALQFPRPDINARYDMIPEEAAVSRARFMEMAAAEKLPVAGGHLPFPGIGTVEKTEAGYVYHSR